MKTIVINEILPFSPAMFNGYYAGVLTIWAEKQTIYLSKVFSKN